MNDAIQGDFLFACHALTWKNQKELGVTMLIAVNVLHFITLSHRTHHNVQAT